ASRSSRASFDAMIATQISTATNTTRYAAATYFSDALTDRPLDGERVDRSVRTAEQAKPARPERDDASVASCQQLPQLAQPLVQPLAGQLDPVHRPGQRQQRRPREAERQ